MFRIKYIPSKSHWIVPPIIMGILAALLIIMLMQRIIAAKKNNEPVFDIKNYSFFERNWDKIKLIGGLVLFVGYIYAMQAAGFLGASMVFIFLFNILFTGIEHLGEVTVAIKEKTFLKNKGFKSVFNSLVISTLFPVGIWFLFGQVFQITLP